MSTLRLTTISNQDGSATVPSQTVISGSAKAWVNFNGTGTVAIRRSFNVSSITDIGSGDYIVNFATAMPDTTYAALGTWSTTDTSWNNAFNSAMVIGGTYSGGAYTAYYSTTQVGVCNYAGATFTDIEQVNIAVFR
jgi:hypothetical protein